MIKPQPIFAADIQALSLFRILFGLVILADFIIGFLPTRLDFYHDTGFLPRAAINSFAEKYDGGDGHISLFDFFDGIWFLELFTWVYGIAIVTFILGYQTRITKGVLLICYLSMQHRGYPVQIGADMLMGLLVVWSCFVPLNRYWSVDSALRRTPRPIDVPPIFMAGIKMQIIMLYLFSGLFKVYGNEWWDGRAIGYAMRDTSYGTVFGDWLATQLPWLSTMLSTPVMIFQICFSLLIYSPVLNIYTRSFALIGAVLMHVAFIACLAVGLFPFVCLSYLVLLIPDTWWNALLAKRRARLETIKLYFDPGCAFCEKIALLLREMCLSPFTQVLPADRDLAIHQMLQQHHSWVVVDETTGKTYLKWRAVAFVLRQNPLTYMVGLITNLELVQKQFASFYDWIGRQRGAFAMITARMLPFNDTPERPAHVATKILCAVMIGAAFANNIAVLPPFAENQRLEIVRDTARVLQVFQKWNLFAPSIVRWQYHYALEGLTSDGKRIDLMPLLLGRNIHKSDDGRLTYTSTRWHKYFVHLLDKNKVRLADRFMEKLCVDYNTTKTGAGAPRISIVFLQRTLVAVDADQTKQRERKREHSYFCP